ncbi:MAG: ABC transporter ATP-binding protein/permease [Lachnospiraceae bacterium]|nr:ABC transporter ATP-binding protein/permease [Lachnospiraceae bacterium]
MEENVKKKKSKPKYSMPRCVGFMVGRAWREKEKKVIFMVLLEAMAAVALNVTNLCLPPVILAQVEARVPLSQFLAVILAFTAMLMIFQAAGDYLDANDLYGRVALRESIIRDLNLKTCRTSYANHLDKSFQEVEKKSYGQVGNNRVATEAIWGTLKDLLTNFGGFVVYTALMAAVDIRIVLLILVTALLGAYVNGKLSGFSYRHREEDAKTNGDLWYHYSLMGNFDAAKDIRIFNLQPWLAELRGKALSARRAFARREQNVIIWGEVLNLALAFVRNGAAYVIFIGLALEGEITASEFLLYFSAVGGFAAWVTGIFNGLTTLYRQCLDLSTVREYLDWPEPFRFEDGEPIRDRKKLSEIRLEDVSYRYPGAEEDTLSHIDLTIRPGEKLAVVGINGAGKTTLVKLICGFLDPTEGRVLLDGQDIRKLNRRDYYDKFSAVFQEYLVLATTVAANVAQTEDDIDMGRVRDCIGKAGLTKKIESLPQGYETKINREVYEDSVEFSGGETQRLMLARALYKDAPFIVLDEPTAALDPIAEADIYAHYNEMTKNRSAVYISHRLASTRFCDRILLIDGHRIAEEGTHEELLAYGGKYAEMFEVQKKYYA